MQFIIKFDNIKKNDAQGYVIYKFCDSNRVDTLLKQQKRDTERILIFYFQCRMQTPWACLSKAYEMNNNGKFAVMNALEKFFQRIFSIANIGKTLKTEFNRTWKEKSCCH